jgi:hypothetical protein
MRNRFSFFLASLVFAVAAASAGCGGGGSSSSHEAAATTGAAPAAATLEGAGTQSSTDTVDDCQMLSAVVLDLGEFDGTGSGFDYVSDRDFLDGYADRAPGGVAASVRTVRDVLDKLASAAQDAGVGVNTDPTEDQLGKIKSAMSYSSDEQQANGQAISQLAVFAGTTC